MFGIADYPAFCLAFIALLILPGPGTFALLSSVSKGGFRAGVAATLGLVAGDQVLLWLAVAGVAALLTGYPIALRALQWVGAAYLAWVGLRLLLARKLGAASPVRIRAGHYARQAFLITLMNPKAILFYMAFLPLFIEPDRQHDVATFTVMAVTVATLGLVYCLLLCRAAGWLAARLKTSAGAGIAMQRVTGVVLIGFGVRLLRG